MWQQEFSPAYPFTLHFPLLFFCYTVMPFFIPQSIIFNCIWWAKWGMSEYVESFPFFFFFFFCVISTFSRCNLERVQAPAVTEKGHGRIWRMADVEALLWLKPYRCCPAYLWTRVLIWALAVSIVFAQKDSLGTRNKWPLLVMRNGSSFHLSSAQQLTLSCPSFKARGSAFFCWFRQVYNIHWWYENSILKLKNRMPSGVNMAFLGAEERVRASLQFHV